jgi:hypothetical protein
MIMELFSVKDVNVDSHPSITKISRHLVEKTAAILDQVMPGWEGRIDRHSLDISSGQRCIIGQLFSRNFFYQGMEDLEGLMRVARIPINTGHIDEGRFGFISSWVKADAFADMPGFAEMNTTDEEWIDMDSLTVAWRDLLEDRANLVSA